MTSLPIRQRLRRLNRGLDTGHMRVFERRVEPNGAHHGFSIDFSSVAALGKMGWRPFGGIGQAIFSFLAAKLEVWRPNVLW